MPLVIGAERTVFHSQVASDTFRRAFWNPGFSLGDKKQLARSVNYRMMPSRDLCESPLTCHSEGAERPKNLMGTSKCEILHSASLRSE